MANGVNKVILVGNLGKEPELSYTKGGTAICSFSLATGFSYFDKTAGKQQEKTEWHNIVAWGKVAENVSKYLNKGRQVYIEGSLRTQIWEDSKTGIKRSKTEVYAETVIFLGGKDSSYKGKTYRDTSEVSSTRYTDESSISTNHFDDDDDIPF